MHHNLPLSFHVTSDFQKTGCFKLAQLTWEDCFSILGFRVDRAWELAGKVVTGAQKASFFTGLEWVQEQCTDKLGFKPFPGTLNLEILEGDQGTLEELQKEEGIKLIPPDPKFCAAKVLPVYLGGSVRGAIVVPAEDVNIHGKKIVEILASLGLRDTLNVGDGDLVTLIIQKYV